jgi:hypothetical protein
MKFLKQKNISKFSISDNTIFANQYGRAVMDLTGGLRLPKGTTDQRPQLINVRTPEGPDGFIRYNTTTNEIEAYVDGRWVTVRAGAAAAITKQTLGPGDYIQQEFGPLVKDPIQDDNIIVLVENVMQISETNYEVLYNYQGSGETWIRFFEPVPLDKFITIYFGYAD